MPEFGQAVASDVWGVNTRTLTDISAEEIFDVPEVDAFAPSGRAQPAAASSSDAFGSWAELVADVGEGKRLIGIILGATVQTANAAAEFEIGEGTGGNEAAITRTYHVANDPRRATVYLPLWVALTDNARLSIRVRDNSSSATAYDVLPVIA